EKAAAAEHIAGHIRTLSVARHGDRFVTRQPYCRSVQRPMPLLEVRALTRSYYGVHALRGVDLSVDEGRITGLIGPNGAGKTTLFNCISGLVPPDAGSVRFEGRITTLWRPDQITG